MDELPSGARGPPPLPDRGPDEWVRFGRWKGVLALMWFYSRTLWIYIPANSIMASSKKNNDLHVTDWNWKSLSSSSSLKPLSFTQNHQAFLQLCASDDFGTAPGHLYSALDLGGAWFEKKIHKKIFYYLCWWWDFMWANGDFWVLRDVSKTSETKLRLRKNVRKLQYDTANL